MQNTKFWLVFVKEYMYEHSCQHSPRVQSQTPWNQLSSQTLAVALENCSLSRIKLNPEKAFYKYSISIYFPPQILFSFEKNLQPFSEQAVQWQPNFLTDLIVILNGLIQQLMRRNYKLWIANHSFRTGCSRCCICHWDHVEFFCSETGGRTNFRFACPHEHLCEFDPRDGVCDSCLEPNQNIPLLRANKGHRHHLIPLVHFLFLGNNFYPIPLHEITMRVKWDGCAPVEKGLSFFLVPSSSPQLLSFHFSLLWLMLYSKLSLVKLIFFQRLQNRIHKGKSYETVKIDHNLDEIQMYSLLLSSL